MKTRMIANRWMTGVAGVVLTGTVLTGGLVGCGEPADDDTPEEQVQASFVLATTVLGDDSTNTYVSYLDSMDVNEVNLDDAREYPGYATIGAVDGMFFVADGESPVITRYSVDDEGVLTEDAQINFSSYVTESPFYANTFANATTAYLDLDDRGHVIWNPTTMEIEGTETTDEIEADKDGLAPFRTFRRGSVVRDNLVFQPFHWRDVDYYQFADTSEIVVYNANDNSVVNVIEAPCAGLDVGTMDAEGNIYFTTWVNAVAAPVIEGEENTHPICAVRIKAGETELDTEWTQDLSEMTGGRTVAAMRILEGDIAVAAVLDHDKVNPGPETDPSAITYASNWELWRLNLAEGTGSKIEGTDAIAGGYYAFKLDGRFFVALPSGDYSQTSIYEITTDGPAEKRFDVTGWVYQLVELN